MIKGAREEVVVLFNVCVRACRFAIATSCMHVYTYIVGIPKYIYIDLKQHPLRHKVHFLYGKQYITGTEKGKERKEKPQMKKNRLSGALCIHSRHHMVIRFVVLRDTEDCLLSFVHCFNM